MHRWTVSLHVEAALLGCCGDVCRKKGRKKRGRGAAAAERERVERSMGWGLENSVSILMVVEEGWVWRWLPVTQWCSWLPSPTTIRLGL